MIKPSPTRYTNITYVAVKFKMPNTRLREICDLLKITIIDYYSRFYIANTDIERIENFILQYISLIRCARDMGESVKDIKKVCKTLNIEIKEVPFKKRAIDRDDYLRLKVFLQRVNERDNDINNDIEERLQAARKLKREYNGLDISSQIENFKQTRRTKMQLTLKDGIEQLVVDNPDNAEEELTALRPTADDIKYLRFLLQKLKGLDDRTIKDEWKKEFGVDEEKYKGDVPRDMEGPGQKAPQQGSERVDEVPQLKTNQDPSKEKSNVDALKKINQNPILSTEHF
jgi:DNA-binding transcriptional MerR regulator